MRSVPAFGVLLSACLAGGLPGTERAVTRAVRISEFRFLPAELTVARGDTLVWTNQDAFLHTTTADSGAWSSAELQRGGRFAFVASRAGRFRYHCAAHPVMQGTIIVAQ
jgi:plastocyanin